MPVELSDEQDDPLETSQLGSLAQLVLVEEKVDPSALVSVTFIGTEPMSELNARHLGMPSPTDVLAFPIEDLSPGSYPSLGPEEPPLLIGDVVICPEVVRSQALDVGVSFDDEMALMVVHGVLHLLGYDHEEDEEAKRMERREQELLAMVGRTRR